MWRDIYRSFVQTAGDINYNLLTKTELANGYCDSDESGDEESREKYYAALMLKYWYMVSYTYNNSLTLGVTFEDVVFWIAEALDKGLKYRRWRDPKHKLSKDINGAEKVFNRAFWSVRNGQFIHANRQKRSPEEALISIDELTELYGQSNWAITEKAVEPDHFSKAQTIIQELLNDGKYLEALVVDGIAYQDTFTNTTYRVDEEDGKMKRVLNSLSMKKLVNHIISIDRDFIDYFVDTYEVSNRMITNTVQEVSRRKRTEVTKQINQIMSKLKKNNNIYTTLLGH